MAAVGQAEVAELWARLGQPDHTVVLDVAATLDVDFSQVRAAAGQVHQAFVVNVDAAYVWGKKGAVFIPKSKLLLYYSKPAAEKYTGSPYNVLVRAPTLSTKKNI